MIEVTHLAPELQDFFTRVAERVARETKFVQRESKLTGALFLRALVFGFADEPQANLEDLVETLDALGVPITKQGLQDRVMDAVPFVKTMFERSLRLLRPQVRLDLAALKVFSGVFITDSTTVALPEGLRSEFAGCGGDGPAAALKIQLTLEWLTGAFDTLEFQAGRAADQGYGGHLRDIRPGAVYLSDLGYFCLAHFRQIDQQQAYFLSRLDLHTAVFDAASAERLDLLAWLRAQTTATVETDWLIGVDERLPCRGLVTKLPSAVADRRRQKAREAARAKGRTLSPRHLELLGWTIYLTNVPARLLTLDQIVVLYAVRWQIELMFKIWKSQCDLERVAGHRRERVLTELYAKLIGLVVTQWLSAPLRIGERELSPVKVQNLVQRYARCVAQSLDSLEHLATNLTKLLTRCRTSALKDKRRKRLTTFQLLQTTTSG